MNIKKTFSDFTNMCPMAWEALCKTALMAFTCAFCALIIAIHGEETGGLTRQLIHIKAIFAEMPAGLFLISAIGVPLLQSLHGGK